MKLILSIHNLTLTKAIEDHIIAKVDKLDHLEDHAIHARVVLEHDHTKAPEKQFKISMTVSLPIDLVTKKIEQQLRKRHDKIKNRKHSEAARGKKTRQEAEI
jgi:ribosome-associated translation inhibitor RaiA